VHYLQLYLPYCKTETIINKFKNICSMSTNLQIITNKKKLLQITVQDIH